MGHTVVHGVNATRNSTDFLRRFPNGTSWEGHAETICLKKAEKRFNNIIGADLYVMRFRKNGSIGCSKPCSHCQEAIRTAGIRRVYYTDANGNWQIMKMN